MSTIVAQPARLGDKLIYQVKVYLNDIAERCNVVFVSNQNKLYILSSDKGAISNNQLQFSPQDKGIVDVILENKGEKDIECFVSYLQGDNLVDSESAKVVIINPIKIEDSIARPNIIRTYHTNDPKERMSKFIESLDDIKSNWKISIEYKGNINLKVVSHGLTKGMFCLGEESKEVLSNDFTFSLDPQVTQLIIPIEIIKKYFHRVDSKLFIHEIVKPDFMKAINTVFKVKVSNALLCKDIESTIPKPLWKFRTPCGVNFDSVKWKIGVVGLPVKVN